MRIKPSDDALGGATGLLSPRISRILTDWGRGDSRGDRENREREGIGGRDAIHCVRRPFWRRIFLPACVFYYGNRGRERKETEPVSPLPEPPR